MMLLKVENVSSRFGNLVAVDDVSMVVEPGELRAIMGPNGAGKTTLFNLISGFLAPTSGRVLLRNEDITRLPPAHRVWRGMARTFQVAEIFPELPVRENLRIAVEAASRHRPRTWLGRAADAKVRAQVDDLLEKGGLAGKCGGLAGELSHGDQRATEIMMALALRPRLLLLDEPTAGMGDQCRKVGGVHLSRRPPSLFPSLTSEVSNPLDPVETLRIPVPTPGQIGLQLRSFVLVALLQGRPRDCCGKHVHKIQNVRCAGIRRR